jgi:hypothetical protein
MLIIVDDKRERISFCDMEIEQFYKISAIVAFARTQPGLTGKIAAGLIDKCHWIFRPEGMRISLVWLSWEQIFMFNAGLMAMGSQARKSVAFLTLAIEAAISSALKSDSLPDIYGESAKDIQL